METNEPQAAESVQSTESSSTTSLFQGSEAAAAATPHPLDAIFSEDVLSKIPDGPQKNWLASQKNGEGLLKGIAGFQQLAGKKGFERPGDDATPEVKEAFNQKLRELNGLPAAIDGYSVKMPEGVELEESILSELNKFGFDKGIPPAHIEALLPLQVALQQKADEQRIQQETQKLAEAFESEDALKKAEPALRQYAIDKGYDLDDSGVKTAAFWKAINHSMQLEQRIAHLTGEDVAVQGGTTSAEGIDKQLETFMDPKGADYAALFNPMHPNYKAANKRFDDLTRAKAEAAMKRK